ncbi:aldehyde ferredoxin oxidoreductase family protein [Thermodesulfobacteriota bacterium]
MMEYLRGGKILRVNLTDGKVSSEPTAHYEDFIGGKGINIKLLFDGVEARTGPFDPENLLLFGVGPLVGTPFPGACRTDVMARSPVTGALGNSGMGGYLGAELKFAGFDNLVIEGKADSPVYLAIQDDRVEIRDASAFWGRDTYETPLAVREDLGDFEAQVVCIGRAGENLVVYAAIMSGTGNAAARTGMGSVMGSKNLKAIAVHGTGGVAVARPREVLERSKSLLDSIRQSRLYDELHEIGITRIHDREMSGLYELLGHPWQAGEAVHEEAFMREHLSQRVGCFACPMACFDGYRILGIGSGTAKCSPYGDLSWDLRNSDMMVFWKTYVDCQRYGLDSRSLSNATAWLMELHEKGIISAADTDGTPMNWGSADAILPMARKMSFREGIGDVLAGGLPAAARKFGKAAEDCLLISKGSPSDMHMAPIKALALASAVSAVGEDAQVQPFVSLVSARRYATAKDQESYEDAIKKYKDRAEKDVGIREAVDPRVTEGKAALVRRDEERTDLADMVGVCTWMTSFMGLPVDDTAIADFMTLGSGTTVDAEGLSEAALRMHHLERAFLAKCGFSRHNDTISKAFFDRLRPHGRPMPELGLTEAELEKMKDDYYRHMGWDLKTGMPTRETLLRYGLADAAESLGM